MGVQETVKNTETISQPTENAQERTILQDWIWMFTELLGFRDLIWQMLLRDLRLRYKQAVMGILWAIFVPVMVVFSGSVLKFVMATIAGQPLELGTFTGMSVKALGWAFFLGILNNGANSLLGNINLITKIYFPREAIIVSGMLVQFFDSFIGSLVLACLLVSVGAVCWTWNLLWIPLLVILLACTALGIGMFLSCAMVFYRDVKYILSVFTSFGMFFTPIFFEVNQLGPKLSPIMLLNPVAPLLEGLRLSIVRGHDLLQPLYDAQGVLEWHPGFLLYSAVFSVLCLLISWRYFHLKEKLYAEFI
ncbi:MAG: ABC transporter permease [Thermoguttaceae bacterium]|nr:ABC transporter permease [Thermoguttaceae bacterium]